MKRQLAELEATNRQLAEERVRYRTQCKELIQIENSLSGKVEKLEVCLLKACESELMAQITGGSGSSTG